MLPQRPYIPSGTLRRAVSYPQAADSWSFEEIGEALEKVGLGHLKDKVEEDAPWTRRCQAAKSSDLPSQGYC